MGLLSNIFSAPSKESIDRQIAEKKATIARLQGNIATFRANAVGKSASDKRNAQLNIAGLQNLIAQYKGDIARLQAERKHAK